MADRRLAEEMSSYWVNFAKSGNPNSPNLPPGRPSPTTTVSSSISVSLEFIQHSASIILAALEPPVEQEEGQQGSDVQPKLAEVA